MRGSTILFFFLIFNQTAKQTIKHIINKITPAMAMYGVCTNCGVCTDCDDGVCTKCCTSDSTCGAGVGAGSVFDAVVDARIGVNTDGTGDGCDVSAWSDDTDGCDVSAWSDDDTDGTGAESVLDVVADARIGVNTDDGTGTDCTDGTDDTDGTDGADGTDDTDGTDVSSCNTDDGSICNADCVGSTDGDGAFDRVDGFTHTVIIEKS